MWAFLLLLALAFSAQSEVDYVYGLIDRVTDSVSTPPLPDEEDLSKKFHLEIIPYEEDMKDIFQIDATEVEDTVSLKGTNGLMLAYAFNMLRLLGVDDS